MEMVTHSLTKHARKSIKKESTEMLKLPKPLVFIGFYGYNKDGIFNLFGKNDVNFATLLTDNLKIGRRYKITIIEVD